MSSPSTPSVPRSPAGSGLRGPFAFELDSHSGPGIERMRVGTPPIIAFAALDAAPDIRDEVAIETVRLARRE